MYGYSFSRVKFVEKREIRGTDYAQGHTYDDILVQNGGYCVKYPSNFVTRVKKCLRIAYRLLRGRFTFPCSLVGFYELTEMCFGYSPALAVKIFGNVILLDQSHASKNI